ncbi:glycosyltransferase family 2 protein [Geodermatophilus sp. YIM 151500]|uniref:glycosyltransferase family 2 protein n=1 Tax=Geodermatophilus sp. YIM 151500 TaxID=2984531 RepID=UPI0021E3D5D3|nr:glycosyltransferase family 2 protein [Geodermatophilus sp. YIM 151500]MCV2488580.1 glycosyltransferase family 2 protein [Geodermatophilus sp. YIM 151500]
MDVTAVVLAYGEQPYLHEVVDRVLASTGVDARVVVVDNGCTSPDLGPLRDRPGVSLLEPGTNTGFTGGCNLGAAAATTEYLAFVNSDALVEPGALAALVATAARPEVGLASASLRLADTPDLLNTSGNPVHVLGLSWAGNLGEPASAHATPGPIASATGAAFVVRREVWDALGGFTEPFFAYAEDADLSMRCWQQGWDVVYVPDAVVLHHYEFGRNPAKFYLLERNRLAMVLSLYERRTLLLLAPTLLAFELAMLVVAAAGGWLPAKLRGYRWLVANRRWLAGHRRAVQRARRRRDREIAHLLTARFDQTVLPLPVGGGLLNGAMSGYWSGVRRLL